jgi:hypothetical protein
MMGFGKLVIVLEASRMFLGVAALGVLGALSGETVDCFKGEVGGA